MLGSNAYHSLIELNVNKSADRQRSQLERALAFRELSPAFYLHDPRSLQHENDTLQHGQGTCWLRSQRRGIPFKAEKEQSSGLLRGSMAGTGVAEGYGSGNRPWSEVDKERGAVSM